MNKANKKLVPDPICVEICVDEIPVAILIGKASMNVINICSLLLSTNLKDVFTFYEVDDDSIFNYVDYLLNTDYENPVVRSFIIKYVKMLELKKDV